MTRRKIVNALKREKKNQQRKQTKYVNLKHISMFTCK